LIDRETIRFYDQAAQRMTNLDADGPPAPALARFMARLAPGAAVLDLGCGAGVATAHLDRAGFSVTSLDASTELLAIARRLTPGATLVHGTFDAVATLGIFDGIWANFALLHAPRSEMPRHLAAIADALKPGGVFHLSMLIGGDERRDQLGRAYTYYTADELRRLTSAAGFVERDADQGEKTGQTGLAEPFIALLLEAAP
jgi:SAM-dependent methyltransferase